MDTTLIKEFRDRINEENLGPQIFCDYEGKNIWNILCSAMDWIEVTVPGINIDLLSRDNTNDASIKVITFLSCIATMWEAISQLHRALFTTSKIPFSGDKSVFGQRISDNEFFKTIRACFASHQINLQKVFEDDAPNERWYASWSGGTFSEKDFAVFLYSNIPGKSIRSFDIQFSQLMLYAEMRYQYLYRLMIRYQEIVNEYKESYRRIPIITKESIPDRIDVLITENERRLGNDYYDYELKEIRMIYNVEYTSNPVYSALLEEYREAFLPELNEIQYNLQNMIQENLRSKVNEEIPLECHYEFSKLSEMVWDNTSVPMIGWSIERLNGYVQPVVTLDKEMSLVETYVLFKVACYKLKTSQVRA